MYKYTIKAYDGIVVPRNSINIIVTEITSECAIVKAKQIEQRSNYVIIGIEEI